MRQISNSSYIQEVSLSKLYGKYLFTALILMLCQIISLLSIAQQKVFNIQPAETATLVTEKIQKAIDSCFSQGGGTVRLVAGTYLSGTIQLKNNVTLLLAKGAVLQGSENYRDYINDAFIYAKDASKVAIQGYGIIDGVDCFNPNGEEKFRGPHCIKMINCKDIYIKGITIKNSANWAINCRYSSKAVIDSVSIRGGHDGLHTRFCSNFKVTNCDFRTGDDAFAGNDNQNFTVTDCKINTSCNGFRMGCYGLLVKNCTFWGLGEYIHKIQKRSNMLAAFVHFSPKDDNPKIKSGKWLIEDLIVEQVDNFYIYNFKDGLWQTGQPAMSISFKNIQATNILKAFAINGDSARQFELTVNDSKFSFRDKTSTVSEKFEGANFLSNSFFTISNFGAVNLNNVIIEKMKIDLW